MSGQTTSSTSQGPDTSPRVSETPLKKSKYSSSHPVENILSNPHVGTRTRGQLKNLCAFNVFVSLVEPKNIKEALAEADWIIAMQFELNEFERNKVWNLVPTPQGKSIIGTRWVFRNKCDEQGKIIKNKLD